MKLLSKRWAKYALMGMLVVVCATAISEARFFRFWWFRPPVPAIQDGTFDDVAANFGRLRFISIEQGVGITQNVSALLQQDTTTPATATVSGGGTLLSFDPIILNSLSISLFPNGHVV